jgi:hypothetical protein
MAICDIVSGYTLGCRTNTGGDKNIYILSGSISSVTGAANGLLTTIAGNGVFYKFELVKETADHTETITASDENGTVFYDVALNAMFHKMQSATRNQIKVLAQNPNLKIIVETNNGAEDGIGKYFLLGYHNGMTLNTGTAASGKAFGDMNGYSLTFTGKEPQPAYEVSGSVLSGVLSGIQLG